MTATLVPTEDPEARRTQRLLKTGKRVGIVGLVVLLIGGTMLGTGLFRVFKDLSQTREQLTTEIAVPGTSEVHLEPGTYDLVVIGQGLLERSRTSDGERGPLMRTGYMEPNVRITGRVGTPGGALALGGGALLALGGLITIGGIATYATGHVRRNRHRARFGPMPGWASVPGPPGYGSRPRATPPKHTPSRRPPA